MEAIENTFIEPFDTVVNFNEDFPSIYEPPEKSNLIALKSNQLISETVIQAGHCSKVRTKKRRTNMVILKMRSLSEDKLPQRVPCRPQNPRQQQCKKRTSSLDNPVQPSHRSRSFRLTSSRTRFSSTPEKRPKKVNTLHNRKGLSKSFASRLYLSTGNSVQQPDILPTSSPTSRVAANLYSSRSEQLDTLDQLVFNPMDDASSLSHLRKENFGPVYCPSFTNGCSAPVKELPSNRDAGLASFKKQLQTLQEQLKDRMTETEKVIEELTRVRANEKLFKARVIELSQAGSVKAHVVLDLKSKISELFAEVESLRSAHSRALDHQADLQEEVASLRRSRDWFEDQLRLTQTIRDRLEAEATQLRELLKSGNEINHRLSHENACLQAQLICNKASLADVRRSLSHQLESIRIDMIEREAVFERMAVERADLERLNTERSNEVIHLQTEVDSLKAELLATDSQMTHQRSKLEHMEMALLNAEQQRTDLQEMLSSIEAQHCAQEEKLKEQTIQFHEALVRIQALEAACEDKNTQVSLLMEDKNSLSASLDSALKEKENLNAYLSTLKDNLSRIEDNFEKVRIDLELKNLHLSELCGQRNYLTDKLEQTHHQLQDCYATISRLTSDRSDLAPVANTLARPPYCDSACADGITVPSKETVTLPKTSPLLLVHNSASYTPHEHECGTLTPMCTFPNQLPSPLLSMQTILRSVSPETQKTQPMEKNPPEVINKSAALIGCGLLQHGDSCNGVTENSRPSSAIVLINSTSFSPHAAVDNLSASGSTFPTLLPTSTQIGTLAAIDSVSRFPHLCPNECQEIIGTGGIVGSSSLNSYQEPSYQPQLSPLKVQSSTGELTKPVAKSVSPPYPRNLSNYFGEVPQENLNEQSKFCSSAARTPNSELWQSNSSVSFHFNNDNVNSVAVVTSTLSTNVSNSSTSDPYAGTYRDSTVVEAIGFTEPELFSRVETPPVNHITSSYSSLLTTGCAVHLPQEATHQQPVCECNYHARSTATSLPTACFEAETQTTPDQLAVLDSYQPALRELEVTRESLRIALIDLAAARKEAQFYQFKSSQLQESPPKPLMIDVDELAALHTAVKTKTDQLNTATESLKQARHETQLYQSKLDRLKGVIQAHSGRFSSPNLFDHLVKYKSQPGEIAHSTVSTSEAFESGDIGLKGLNKMNGDGFLSYSKPLNGLNKFFESLQIEMTNLEEEMVSHILAVNSVQNSNQPEDESYHASPSRRKDCNL